MSEAIQIENSKFSVEPKKLIVWLFSISISMIFAALTSAYIVRRAEGNWLEFNLPNQLLLSTIVIVISSAVLYIAQRSFKTDNKKAVQISLAITLVLGLVFSYLQYLSWTQLHLDGIYFTGPTSNPSGSFIYVLIWTHLFHIVTGLLYLIIVLYKSFNLKLFVANSTVLESCAVYWHFLGLLWIYLYLFLYFYH